VARWGRAGVAVGAVVGGGGGGGIDTVKIYIVRINIMLTHDVIHI
jgi:hypothetical protein